MADIKADTGEQIPIWDNPETGSASRAHRPLQRPTLGKSIHSPQHQKLRELLVAARKKAKLTQAEVAEQLGRPQSCVAKYEGGERRLDVIEFMQVARTLGADPTKIMRSLG
jgi:DNA-binding transcriptional regulator YiaG